MSPNLAVDILFGTFIVDRFMRGIFPVKRKVVPCHSQLVARLSGNEKRTDTSIIGNSEQELPRAVEKPTNEKWHGPVRVARQIELKQFMQHPVLVQTSSMGLITIEPKQISANCFLLVAANCIVDVLRRRPFYIYTSNLSRKAVRLTKHMVIAQTAKPPTVICTVFIELRRGFQLKTPDEVNPTHSVSEENATSETSIADDVAAVHYKPQEN